MCFLVATARRNDANPQLRHLVRDGVRGEWGASWKAAARLAPLESPPVALSIPESPSTWSLFSRRSEVLSEPDWVDCGLDTVECDVGISVWPGNTLYRPTHVEFEI